MVSSDEIQKPVQHDIWVEYGEKLGNPKELEKIEEFLIPIEAKEYLEIGSTNIVLLNEIQESQLRGEPMLDDCICSVVIPAHNENTIPKNVDFGVGESYKTNIIGLLEALNNQNFSEASELKPENFEIIIVDNNSIDETAAAAKKWVEENNPRMIIKVISQDFPPELAGVGSARKLGADLSILRASQREETIEHYTVGLDADNIGIPTNHFEKVIQTFRSSGTKVLTGEFINDPKVLKAILGNIETKDELLTAINAFYEYRRKFFTGPEYTEFKGLLTSGANHAIDTRFLMQIRGYPPWKTGEDRYIGRAANLIVGGIGYLDSRVSLNMRRVISDPEAQLSGRAYVEDRFAKDNEVIRSGVNLSETTISIERLQLSMVNMVDSLAETVSLTREIPWHDAVMEVRKAFEEMCRDSGVSPNILLQNDLFYMSAERFGQALEISSSMKQVSADKQENVTATRFRLIKEPGGTFIKRLEGGSSSESEIVLNVDSDGVPLI